MKFVGAGKKMENLILFDADAFVEGLFGDE